MPYYNHWDLVHARLYELYTHIPATEIILVNDCSTEADCETGPAWWQKEVAKHKIYYVKNKENLGFGGSMNKGAATAIKHGADIIVLLSDDVIVKGNFLPLIVNAIESNKPNKVLVGGEVIYWDSGWNTIDGTVVPHVNGWMVACEKDVWTTLGGFDPLYGKFDAEDLDISTTALFNGIKLVGLNTPMLQHLFGQTINAKYPDRVEHTKRNILLWQHKWKDKIQEMNERQP